LQIANAPFRLNSFLKVILPRGLIFDGYKGAIVSPGQFATHCVANWKHKIELPHSAQV
jgi:hypothetical protein